MTVKSPLAAARTPIGTASTVACALPSLDHNPNLGTLNPATLNHSSVDLALFVSANDDDGPLTTGLAAVAMARAGTVS
jgi:hypothetical protein